MDPKTISALGIDEKALAAKFGKEMSKFNGNWALGGVLFLIEPAKNGKVKITPTSNRKRIIKQKIKNVIASEESISFQYTVTWKSHSNLGGIGIIRNRTYQHNYDLKLISPNLLQGNNRSGSLDVGTTGLHDRYTTFHRVYNPRLPTDGIYGRWVVESFSGIMYVCVDKNGKVSLSQSKLQLPKPGLKKKTSYTLETVDRSMLNFSLRIITPWIDSQNVYKCNILDTKSLKCKLREDCAKCTHITNSSITAYKLKAH